MRINFLVALSLLIFIAVSPRQAKASALICETHGECNDESSGSTNEGPSRGNVIRMNPSAIPVEKGLGIETIYYGGSFDFSLVKGLGRVGAALSPSNSEQTFFGPPGFELPEDFLQRNLNRTKYQSGKFTLGSAFNIYSNKRNGFNKIEVNLGAMLKYNSNTGSILPGLGLSGIAGPFTFGYSLYNDQTQYNYAEYGLVEKPLVSYLVETYSLGLFLDKYIFDYSLLRVVSDTVATVSVYTATAIVKKFILVAAYRSENSDRPAYDFASRTLVNQQVKTAEFGGVQYHINDILMVGAFYNYYLLREFSVGATLFF